MAFFDKIRDALGKTRKTVSAQLDGVFSGLSAPDEAFYEELEEALIGADMGVETTMKITGALRSKVKAERLRGSEPVRAALKEILVGTLRVGDPALKTGTTPSVILVIGVNGVGKTTTIGKLAASLKSGGSRVLLCAADTFRAAAADQLEIWAGRSGVEIVRQGEGADPASVVFDSISAARARNTQVIICDTAGRLHNKQNLMNELSKITRVIKRELPEADMEILLVLDAVTGQNGLVQARQFKEAAGVTGLVLTKLDGTAKGGIAVAVADTLQIPVKLVGVGEKIEDLIPFDAESFIDALI